MAPLLPHLAGPAASGGGASCVEADVLATLTGAAGPAGPGRLVDEGVWVEVVKLDKTRAVLLAVSGFGTRNEVLDLVKLRKLH